MISSSYSTNFAQFKIGMNNSKILTSKEILVEASKESVLDILLLK